MMWLTTALQVILLYEVSHTMDFNWSSGILSYDDSDIDGDLYFDRLTAVVLNITSGRSEKTIVAAGIWIASDRILTSYNPFRTILRNKTLLSLLRTGGLYGRIRKADGSRIYKTTKHLLVCGRQVQFLADKYITENALWHGADQINCPLHDLMVFRIDGNNTLSTLTPEEHTMAALYPDGYDSDVDQNFFLAKLANPFDQMGGNFKFAHLHRHSRVKVIHYDPDDDAVVDCAEWMPREWGYFICIRNKNDLKMMASGAMLVSNLKLFGVGSFVMFRGDTSILVFTDVRPYYGNILNTCTYFDSEEMPPTTFPIHT